MNKIKVIALTMLAFVTIASTVFVSCNKQQTILPTTNSITVKKELPTIKKERFWQYIVAVVIVIVANTEGQWSQTTNTVTNAQGTSTTTTTTCSGLGHCSSGMVINNGGGQNDPLNENEGVFLNSELNVNAKLAVTESNDIILLVENGQNSQEINNKFFYDEYIYFMPNDYKVNNQNVLRQLGLNEPFTIKGANYPVYTQENMKFIVVGHKS